MCNSNRHQNNIGSYFGLTLSGLATAHERLPKHNGRGSALDLIGFLLAHFHKWEFLTRV